MSRTPTQETKAAARRRLTKEMQKLGTSIEKKRGPERLALLRRQASVSDALETLRSGRP